VSIVGVVGGGKEGGVWGVKEQPLLYGQIKSGKGVFKPIVQSNVWGQKVAHTVERGVRSRLRPKVEASIRPTGISKKKKDLEDPMGWGASGGRERKGRFTNRPTSGEVRGGEVRRKKIVTGPVWKK